MSRPVMGSPSDTPEIHGLMDEIESLRVERDAQMQGKLDAQVALLAITEALALPLNHLGTSWTTGAKIILARIETIVDEAERGFKERDEMAASLTAQGVNDLATELIAVRADLMRTRTALREIKDYVLLEYQEGDKPFQVAILAATVLDETSDPGAA